ncbi:hypothetical protein [Carnobacterium iners]|uniref:hypothetical protein n=1 Tax=Carnobacterium iners TaxID=1073423 RepID=UPI000A1CA0CE|nr:hypothetical protein [Carnobacterium iners]
MGIAFGTVATIFRNKINDYRGVFNYIEYEDIEDNKPIWFPVKEHRYTEQSTDIFASIPGIPIAYWASDKLVNIFKYTPLEKLSNTRQGMIPGNTNEFLRYWFEVSIYEIGFNHEKSEDILLYGKKWFPYNKGGAFRRWYGNVEHIINMENDGFDIKYSGKNNNYRLRDPKLYFKEAITWSKISSGKISTRYMSPGCMFDIAGCCIFISKDELKYILAFSNSIVASKILSLLVQL